MAPVSEQIQRPPTPGERPPSLWGAGVNHSRIPDSLFWLRSQKAKIIQWSESCIDLGLLMGLNVGLNGQGLLSSVSPLHASPGTLFGQ